MSYLVLARKWRPKVFEDLIGQEPISRILKNAITQGRIAHAYLFSGPRGVGKTTTARILSKSINCEKGPTPTPCGVCISCKGIVDGTSVDVMEIDGASNNSVNDIRDLREGVKYAAACSRYKVYIIDEVHMLSDAAFNALLKTLEEPPAHVVFVLATTAPRKVPATVLSRCQHLPFRRIPVQKIKERLRMISDSEGIKISDAALEMIARVSEGSMRDSLTILDQVSAFSSDIEESEIKDLLGVADFKTLSELSTAVIRGDRRKIIELIDGLVDTGTDLKSFSKDLLNFFRDLLIAKVVNKPEEVLDISEGEISLVKEILKMTSEDHLTLLLGELVKAESDVRIAFSPRVALEMSLIKASFLNSLKPVKEAIENIETFIADISEQGGHPEKAMEAREEDTQIEPVYNAPEATPAEDTGAEIITKVTSTENPVNEDIASPSIEDYPYSGGEGYSAGKQDSDNAGGSFWERVVGKIENTNHLLACKLSEARAEMDGDALVVTFNGGSAIHADSVKSNKRILEDAVSNVLNRKVFVRIETANKKVIGKRELKEKIMSEPLVNEALELFEGRIVDIKSMGNPENGGGKDV